MHDTSRPADPEQWVIWNGSAGILTLAAIGRIELGSAGRTAWLERPFDMVGPFSLDELENQGRIAFAACIVMSRQRWQDDQAELRREALASRRAAQARQARSHHGPSSHPAQLQASDERAHREALKLPADAKLEPTQIKAAFRRLAQKLHPDVGGSHEQFLRITEARDALLAWVS